MAQYEMQESSLPNSEGKRVLFPRIKLEGQYTLDDMAGRISRGTTFSPSDIKGIVSALADAIAKGMGEGRSVKIEGLGIFTPALSLRDGTERESGNAGEARRNATSICVGDIRFKADKRFLRTTEDNCHLERATEQFRKSSTKYTAEERLRMAQEYLAQHASMTVTEYCKLTGLLPTSASQELRKWREQEGTGIGTSGKGTHKVYVRKD